MDILLISECFLIVALIVFLIATLRIITYKSTSMGLIGTSSFTLALTLLLIAVGTIFNIGFFKDIALALLLNMIQSILLVISALLILIAVVGVLRIDRNLDNVVYARIHILGIVDVAGIIAFLALGQPLFALIYLFLAPLLAHALANAYFHSEDTLNNPVLNPNLEETSDKEENEDETDLIEEVILEDNLDMSDDSSEELDEKSEDDGND